MTDLGWRVMLALKWGGLTLAFLLWCLLVYRSVRSVKRLQVFASRMKGIQNRSYPEKELHPLLCNVEEASLPDPEEEKAYPYYQRTGQIISATGKYSNQALTDHSWFGYHEWTQEWICGRMSRFLFEETTSERGEK